MRRALPEPVRVALAALAAAAVTWRAVLRPIHAGLDGDWGYFAHMWETGRVAVTRTSSIPLWDPFHCGGISLWGNPQAQVYHPLFALAFLLGSIAAMKVFLVAHCAAGVAGMYALARSRAASPGASALAAVAWACSGFFAWHGHAGHLPFAAFYLAPWGLLAWRRAERDPRACVGVAAVFFATLLAGGTYPAPFLALLLVVDAASRATTLTRARDIARAGVVSAGLSLLLGAVRLAPIAVSLHRHPREIDEPDALGLGLLRDMLLARDHAYALAGHRYAWDEYGAFVGVAALALAGVGIVSSLRDRRVALPVVALGFALVTLGDVAPWMPWPLLHRLPVFDSLRVPSRFAVLLTLALAQLAATGVDALSARVRSPRVARALPWCLALLAAVEVTHASSRIIERGAPSPPPPPVSTRLWLDNDAHYFERLATLPAQHRGTVGCYDPLHPDVSDALWTGDVAQARFEGNEGTVLSVTRAQQSFAVEYTASCAARLILDQNHDPDWTASLGHTLDDRGRLAVELPAGHHRVVVYDAPRSLPWAAWATALGALACAWVHRRGSRWSDPR